MPHATALRETHIELLRKLRISITLPRLELLRVIEEAGHALTAHDIYCAHLKSGSNVPLSSIYVNLKRLEEAGVITRIRLDSENKSLYSLAGEQGPMRMVCKQCGKLRCLNDSRLAELMRTLCRDNGFEMQDYAVTVEAHCHHCTAAYN